MVKKRNMERYRTDPEFRQRVIERAKAHNKKVLEVYRQAIGKSVDN